jgi:hypothetical protein
MKISVRRGGPHDAKHARRSAATTTAKAVTIRQPRDPWQPDRPLALGVSLVGFLLNHSPSADA